MFDSDLAILQARAIYMLCTELTQRCQGQCKQHPSDFDDLDKPRKIVQGPWVFRFEPRNFHIKLPIIELIIENTEKILSKNDLVLLKHARKAADQALIKSFADLMDLTDGRWIDNVYATKPESILNIDKFKYKDGVFVSEQIVRVQELWHGCQFQSWVPLDLRKLLMKADAYTEYADFETNDLYNAEYIADLNDHGTHVK